MATPPDMGFDGQWPELKSALTRMLRARGVSDALVDDFVQETGIRLWKMWEDVDPARPAVGLAKVIALNLLRDHYRSAVQREVAGDIPETAAYSDIEHQALARTELGTVARALRRLKPSHQRVLLAEVGVGAPGMAADTSGTRMLRMRARRELSAMVDRAAGFGVVVTHRVAAATRSFLNRATARLGGREGEAFALVVAGALVVVTGASLVPPSHGATAEPDRSRGDGIELLASVGDGLPLDLHPDVGFRPDFSRLLKEAKNPLREAKLDRPLANGRIGRYGNFEAEAEVESLGLRVGTNDDGSVFVGCSDGTETGATGAGRCDIGKGETHAKGDVRYRVGKRRGRIPLSTDP